MMKFKVKYLVAVIGATAFLFYAGDVVSAQSQVSTSDTKKGNGRVESKTDEFTGKRTVTLRDLSLDANLSLDLTLERDTTRKMSPVERDIEFATARFVSTDKAQKFGSFEGEFNFLVDGKRVHGGKIKSETPSVENIRAGREKLIGVFDMTSMPKIIKGSVIRMKVGEKVFVINENVRGKLREFYDALER